MCDNNIGLENSIIKFGACTAVRLTVMKTHKNCEATSWFAR